MNPTVQLDSPTQPAISVNPTAEVCDIASGLDDHLQLFSTQAYNQRNLGPGQQYLRVDHHDGSRLVGSFVGVCEGNRFSSGFSAPFCGPDFVRGRETPANVQALVDHTFSELARRGIEHVSIKARPASYSGNETYVQHALLRRGLQVTDSELSFGIDLGTCTRPSDYRSSLKGSSRRALRYSDAEPFDYRMTETPEEFATAYEVIRANRQAKGNPLRLSLAYLGALQADFGDRIRFFLLRHDDRPVGAALLYRLRPDIELVEYWGDAHDLERSPMNRLAEEVCCRAIEEGIRLVDLGISSVDGVPNEGLIQFKQSIGATAELRLNFDGAL